MNVPKYEVAEVIHRFLPSLRPKLSLHQLRMLSALERCRTSSLGAHLDACDSCGQVRISYNSPIIGAGCVEIVTVPNVKE